MGSLWDTIKDQGVPARDLANDGIVVVEDPVRGAPVRVQRTEGLKFRPLDPRDVDALIAGRPTREEQRERNEEISGMLENVFDADTINGQRLRDAIKQLDANDSEEPRAIVTLEKQGLLLPAIEDDFSDLVGDLSEPEPVQKLGRPRKYANNAERQRAYRATKKPKTKRVKKK